MLSLKRRIKPAFIVIAVSLLVLVLRHGYDTLIDEQHRLHVAHGRVLIEQQQRWDTILRSWDAVDRYREIEQKIMERLITINSLIKTGAGKARIEEERKKVAGLATELDLLKEAYPSLKAQDPYLHLMELMETAG
ncbi:MAG: LemA family protein, partial [Nitrospirota bacterium]|nr:LemA family protein [Nitrospirota bacterium]